MTKQFKKAYKELPNFIGGIDFWYHKTPDDLAWLVLHEMDLYNEGEENDISPNPKIRLRQ